SAIWEKLTRNGFISLLSAGKGQVLDPLQSGGLFQSFGYQLYVGLCSNPSKWDVTFWNLVKLISTPTTTPALVGGGLLGYVIYDCTHYYLHHGQPSNDVHKHLKRYHLNHHFRIQDKGFGITSALWDRVFGTLPPSKPYEKISQSKGS
ncbi:hypothetical protein IFM89_002604, partial [Coptis chinensis]